MRRTFFALAAATLAAAGFAALATPAKSVSTTGFLAGGFGANVLSAALSPTPVPIHGSDRVTPEFTAIAAGGVHNLAIIPGERDDPRDLDTPSNPEGLEGCVASWGLNASSELGQPLVGAEQFAPGHVRYTVVDPDTEDELEFNMCGVTAVSAGKNHSVALLRDGTVYAWGKNDRQQIVGGDGLEPQYLPRKIDLDWAGRIVAISAGDDFTLALAENGDVAAWGAGESGQLGNGHDFDLATPQLVAHGISQISAGGRHALAVTAGGFVVSWGANDKGQLGIGTTGGFESRATPVNGTGTALVTAVDAGGDVSTVRRIDGSVLTWGDGSQGTLGNASSGPAAVRNEPGVVPDLSHVAAVDAGGNHVVALMDDGTLQTWGRSDLLGRSGTTTVPKPVPNLSGVVSVSASGTHTDVLARPALLTVRTNPPVDSQISIDGHPANRWGVDDVQLFPGSHTVSFSDVTGFDPAPPTTQLLKSGTNSIISGTFERQRLLRVTTSPAVPATIYLDGVPLNDWGAWTYITRAAHTLCFGYAPGYVAPGCQKVPADETAQPYSAIATYTPGGSTRPAMLAGGFGSNAVRQLGTAQATEPGPSTPLPGAVGPEFIAVTAGAYFTAGLLPDGRVAVWGDLLPLGVSSPVAQSRLVAGLDHIKDLAGAGGRLLALREDGAVLDWGLDFSTLPVIMTMNAKAITTSGSASFAVLTDGTLVGWGRNQFRQLGDRTEIDRATPVHVLDEAGSPLQDIVSVAAAQHHAVALTGSGQMWSWGYAKLNGIGDGIPSIDSVDPKLIDIGGFGVGISAGQEANAVVMNDGTVKAWGNTEGFYVVPTTVPGLAGVVQVASSIRSLAALKSDGTVWTWGTNDKLQLGRAAPSYDPIPAPVPNLQGVTEIAAGYFHTAVLAEPAYVHAVSSPAVPTVLKIDGKPRDMWGVFMKMFPGSHSFQASPVSGFTNSSGNATLPPLVTTTVATQFTATAPLHITTAPSPIGATIYVNGTPRSGWGLWLDDAEELHSVCYGWVPGFTAPPCFVPNQTPGSTSGYYTPD